MSVKDNKSSKNGEKDYSLNKPYAVLGQYVPVRKFEQQAKFAKVSSPIVSNEPTFCIYEGDYIPQITSNQNNLKQYKRNSIFNIIKNIFSTFPITKFLSWKIKQLKIKESINKLSELNEDVSKFSTYFEGKTIINEKKYQRICSELVKTGYLQAKIKNDMLN